MDELEQEDLFNETKNVGSTESKIHIRIQQRNGRKSLTTIQGIDKGVSMPALGRMDECLPLWISVQPETNLEGTQEGASCSTFVPTFCGRLTCASPARTGIRMQRHSR